MANNNIKECSTSLVIKDTELKSFDPATYLLRWLKLKRLTMLSIDKNAKKLYFTDTDGENVK